MDSAQTFVAVVRFPYPWPPSNHVLLVAQAAPHFLLHVLGLPDGCIKALIKYSDGVERDLEYQQVAIPHSGLVIVILVLDGDEVTLYLNGEPLLLRQEAKRAIRHVNVAQSSQKRAHPLVLPDEHGVHDEDEWLFIRSLGDLADKVSRRDKYEMLQATLPLRRLLLDRQPLVHIVNRPYNKKLRFKVLSSFHYPSIQWAFLWQAIDPSLVPQAETVEVNLEGLLSTTCLRVRDEAYSVHDVITTIAYAKHGLHTRGTNTQKQRELVKLDKEHKLFNEEPSIAAMAEVVAVLLDGLEPLVDAIGKRASSQ